MSGMFEQPIGDGTNSTIIGGYEEGKGPKCEKCGSRDTEAVWRDIVWEETGCRCNQCGHSFIKG